MAAVARLADMGHPLGQADGRRRLALAERGGGHRRDDDVAGPGSVLERPDGVERDLGHVAAVGLEKVLADPHRSGDLGDGTEVRLAGDLEGRQLGIRGSSRPCLGWWGRVRVRWAGLWRTVADCGGLWRTVVRGGSSGPPSGGRLSAAYRYLVVGAQIKHARQGADSPDMRSGRLLAVPIALLVPVAAMVATATGVIGPGTWSTPVGAAPAAGGHPDKPGNGPCVLVIPRQPTSVHAGGSAGRDLAPTVRGDVSVAIPPTVFIRVEGKLIVVTTDAGTPRPSGDGFWVVDGHTAAPASTSMRAEVLSGCSTWRRR